ncbi:MAG: Fe-S protein assembly co-chaperone HscB [bacterium]|nr:Fe-S protein assembly co-chaperone HscB [bacterium]
MSATDQTVPSKCLACHADLDTPVICAGCHTLYPVPQAFDYFDLLKLPRRFHLDLDELDKKFLSMSRSIHPDFFGGRSEEMRDLAVRLSAELNEACRVLRDPILRAGYLLENAGGASAAEDRNVPQSVLTEVMMLREELEEADGDAEALTAVKEQVVARRGETLDKIAELADDIVRRSADDKNALRLLINSVKYYDKLLDEMPLVAD